MAVLTLLTDFGTTDFYVGAVKGTVLRLLDDEADPLILVDLSHGVPPGDVEAAADLLAGAAPSFPEGTVHLAVVDPGVGSDRRILALHSAGHLYVAPDNGLLTPMLETAAEIRAVARPDLFLTGPGSTFHGRDRFAPTAAALLRGEPLSMLGPEIDDPVRLERPRPRQVESPSGGLLEGRIVRVDRFGNLVTDIPAAWLRGDAPETEAPESVERWRRGAAPRVEVAGYAVERWVSHYAELPPGVPGALVGSLATIELSLRGRSLAEHWEVARGEPVRIVLPSPSG